MVYYVDIYLGSKRPVIISKSLCSFETVQPGTSSVHRRTSALDSHPASTRPDKTHLLLHLLHLLHNRRDRLFLRSLWLGRLWRWNWIIVIIVEDLSILEVFIRLRRTAATKDKSWNQN